MRRRNDDRFSMPIRPSCGPDAHAAIAGFGGERGTEALGLSQALEETGEEVEVHATHEGPVLLRQPVERALVSATSPRLASSGS